MKNYTRWSTDTGEIIDNPMLNDRDVKLHNTHCTEGTWYQTTHYFLDGEPTEKQPQDTIIDKLVVIVSDGEIATLSNLPDSCTVYIYNEDTGVFSIEVSDNSLELTFELPGQYNIKVEAFPFLQWEINIDAI